MEKSIQIVLSEIESNFEGELVCSIDEPAIIELRQLILESENLNRAAEKIIAKKEQALRRSNLLMRRIIESRKIEFNVETEAVGLSQNNELYVGEKERVSSDPGAPPSNEDSIRGNITKQERRKYDELLENFDFLNKKANIHNEKVIETENGLIEFENKVLVDKEYSKEDNYLIVLNKSKKVFLCKK